MSDWHPLAVRVEAPKDGGTFLTGVGWKSVIHTTEVLVYRPSTRDYYGHQSWPHATIADGTIHQHIPLSRAARALKNAPGGVETNRARAVQVEVVAKAAEIHRLPADQRKALADWLVWVHQQTGAPLSAPEFVGADKSPARVNAPQRFSHRDWLTYTGICGHQHVPENDHWDPGALNLSAVLAFAQEEYVPLSEEDIDKVAERVAWQMTYTDTKWIDYRLAGQEMSLFGKLQQDIRSVRTGALKTIAGWLGKTYKPPVGG